jgi:hypothetical protein
MPFVKSHGFTDSPTYRSWTSMYTRCNNSKAVQFKYYGGKGIKICARWRRFENFLADMGIRPQGTSLDRIDNTKDYEPSNCRWASRSEQSRNRSMNVKLTYMGRTQIVSEWADEIGLSVGVLRFRLKKGWTVERALTTALRGKAVAE